MAMLQFASYQTFRSVSENDKTAALQEASNLARATVFLSHSTQDDDLTGGAIHMLELHGGRVYADHLDPACDTSNSLRVAAHLRDVINHCRKFVLLATPRSKDSRWIPWELGLADGIRRPERIAILPAVETDDQSDASNWRWTAQEYLGLYQRIVYGDYQGRIGRIWMVLNHHRRNEDGSYYAVPLADWLQGP